MNRLPISLLTALVVLAANVGAADPANILGKWNTENGRGVVEVYEKDGSLRAKIISLKEPNFPADDKKGMAGKPKIDRENPDPKLRDRPIAGLEIMHSLKPSGANKWDGGKIYDPETGNTYSCKMTLVSSNHLHLRGYLGISLIGRTTTWTR
jgi:uncharacterized protein (DUF2147 family)